MGLASKTRVLVALALVISALAVPTAASAEEIYPIIFPVLGPNHFTDTFDAPRSGGRTHGATDIMADKMTPVVAAASGTVGWMQNEQGGNCCAMELRHDDGWVSWYIHLNNDTPGTDDGQGWGFAPGITRGVHVQAGQLIGWVGDSGNAENVAPHLHFELHRPDGTKFNPYESLLAATVIGAPLAGGSDSSPNQPDDCPTVVDESGLCDRWVDVTPNHWALPSIEALYASGITAGCSARPLAYCPNATVTRAEMAAFLLQALGIDSTTTFSSSFVDVPQGAWYAAFAEQLYRQGITTGCGTDPMRYCPDAPVSRGEMAVFITQALGRSVGPAQGLFSDVAVDDWYAPYIEELARLGLTAGYGDGTYRPTRTITRAEMAVIVDKAFLGG